MRRPAIDDSDLDAALAEFDRAPSTEALAQVIRRLVSSELGEAIRRTTVEFVADRLYSADESSASRAVIQLHSPLERDAFLTLPVAIRRVFDVWLGDALPAWTGDCPRCDGALDRRSDSYGLPTYTYLFRCSSCGWRADQLSDEPTMAYLYKEMHRDDDERKRREITDQVSVEPIADLTLDTIAEILRAPDADSARLRFAELLDERGHRELASSVRRDSGTPLRTCWPLRTSEINPRGWYGPLVELLGDLKSHGIVSELIVEHGLVDHVALDATAFLSRGRELFARAPIRSITLLEPDDHLGEIFASPLLDQVVGLGLAIARADTPIVNELVRARRLPQLLHIDLGREQVFDFEELSALARAEFLAAITCLHVETQSLVVCDDSDCAISYSWSDFGTSIMGLAHASGRVWFQSILATAERLVPRDYGSFIK